MRIALYITLIVLFSVNTLTSLKAQYYSGLSEECKKYFIRRDSLNKIKPDYFKTHVLEPAIQNTKVSEQNRKFLNELYKYIKLPFNERVSIPILETPIFPIFKLNKNQLGVFVLPKYDCYKKNGYTRCDNIRAEYIEIKKSLDYPKDQNFSSNPKLTTYKQAYHKLVKNNQIYVYTIDSKYSDEIVELSRFSGVSLEYYHYMLKDQTAQNVIIGSPFDLELKYLNFPEIDEKIISQEKLECYDRVYEYKQLKTFAILKGVENIYFTYADNFPINDDSNRFKRSLVMLMEDGTIVTLWSESINRNGGDNL
jgi:hypothetical protein